MRRIFTILLLSTISLLFLSACFRTSADELFSLPQVSSEYLRLQSYINNIINDGAQFAPPTRGPNRQPIQLRDLNGDGIDEVIAFFSVIADSTLKIYIFEMVDDDYVVVDIIEGVGTEFESIRYIDMNGDGVLELVIGWQMGVTLRYMTIYSITGFHHQLLVSGEEFSDLTIFDMNKDGSDDVILFMLASHDISGTAKVFSMMPDGEIVSLESRLSVGVESISAIMNGHLLDGSPAVFVESEGTFENGIMVTDIFTITDDNLVNISLNVEAQVSIDTVRHSMGSSEVNRDGILKTPVLRRLVAQSETAYHAIDWYAYDSKGHREFMLTTYHNNFDEWFLILPLDWRDNVSVRRNDAVPGERTIIFSYFESEDGQHHDFLQILKLSGINAAERAQRDNRNVLLVDGAVAYAFELLESSENLNITLSEDMVRENFRLIHSDWLSRRE